MLRAHSSAHSTLSHLSVLDFATLFIFSLSFHIILLTKPHLGRKIILQRLNEFHLSADFWF